jgi:hypothetical protein
MLVDAESGARPAKECSGSRPSSGAPRHDEILGRAEGARNGLVAGSVFAAMKLIDPRRQAVTRELRLFFDHLVSEARSAAQTLWSRSETHLTHEPGETKLPRGMELPVTTPFTDPRRKVVTGQLQKFFHHLVGEARSVAQRLWCRIER